MKSSDFMFIKVKDMIHDAHKEYEHKTTIREAKRLSAEERRIVRLMRNASHHIAQKGAFVVTEKQLKRLVNSRISPLSDIYISDSIDNIESAKEYHDKETVHCNTIKKFIFAAQIAGLSVKHTWVHDEEKRRLQACGLCLSLKKSRHHHW